MACNSHFAAPAARPTPSATKRGVAVSVPPGGAALAAINAHAAAARVAPDQNPMESRGAPWMLPQAALAVFYGSPRAFTASGRPETPRLFHYFLPRLMAEGKRVLCLDGANRFDPLLLARLARQRGVAAAEYNQRIRVARAFTCFQLTELLVRAPRWLENFPADAIIVTALPDLYFDEDVREREAWVAFRRALEALRALARGGASGSLAQGLPAGAGKPPGVAVFSDATSFQSPRRAMFAQLAAQAAQVWRFALDDATGALRLLNENSAPRAAERILPR